MKQVGEIICLRNRYMDHVFKKTDSLKQLGVKDETYGKSMNYYKT